MTRRKIFISYSHGGMVVEAWLRDFVQNLKELDLDVWFDEMDLAPGDSIADGVEEAFRASDIVVSVLSPSTVNSPDVLFELGAAVGMGKRIVPVLLQGLESSKLPPFARDKKQLQGSPEEAAAALASLTE